MKKVGHMLVIVYVIIGVVWSIGIMMKNGVNSEEISECHEWQQQAAQFAGGYYLLGWQVEQCRAHNISINTPVK